MAYNKEKSRRTKISRVRPMHKYIGIFIIIKDKTSKSFFRQTASSFK